MSKLGSIITSALPVATMLICQRACISVGVCVGVLQCEETCLHALRFVSALRLLPESLALLLQGFPRKCVPNAQCDDVGNSVREMGIDKLLVSSRLPPRVGGGPPSRGWFDCIVNSKGLLKLKAKVLTGFIESRTQQLKPVGLTGRGQISPRGCVRQRAAQAAAAESAFPPDAGAAGDAVRR
jgi:hypothetical protein